MGVKEEVERVNPVLTALFAICAVSTAMETLFDGRGIGDAVRVACGLSIALCIARGLARIIG